MQLVPQPCAVETRLLDANGQLKHVEVVRADPQGKTVEFWQSAENARGI